MPVSTIAAIKKAHQIGGLAGNKKATPGIGVACVKRKSPFREVRGRGLRFVNLAMDGRTFYCNYIPIIGGQTRSRFLPVKLTEFFPVKNAARLPLAFAIGVNCTKTLFIVRGSAHTSIIELAILALFILFNLRVVH